MNRSGIWLFGLFLVVSSCGGSDGSRADGAAGTAGGGGAAGGAAGGPGDGSAGTGDGGNASDAGGAGGTGGNPACDSALDQASCSSEGTVCSSGCTDACSFCNTLRCTAGRWQRMEGFPAPCFACGTTRCQNNAEYCRQFAPGIPTGSVTYACEAVPSQCRPTPTCDCLTPLVGGETGCTESGAGQLTVFFAAP